MFIIGQEKSLADLQVVSNEELDGLAKFLDQAIKEGTPLEIPQAMALRDLGRLVKTAVHYRDEAAKKVETQAEGEEPFVSRLVLPS